MGKKDDEEKRRKKRKAEERSWSRGRDCRIGHGQPMKGEAMARG